jgi:hypothetical protein
MTIRHRKRPLPKRLHPKGHRSIATIFLSRFLASLLSMLGLFSNPYTSPSLAHACTIQPADSKVIYTSLTQYSQSTEKQFVSEGKQAGFEESQLIATAEIDKYQQWAAKLEEDRQALEYSASILSARGDKDGQKIRQQEIESNKAELTKTNQKIKDLEKKRFDSRSYAVQELITNKERIIGERQDELVYLEARNNEAIENEKLDSQVRLKIVQDINLRKTQIIQELKVLRREISEVKSQLQNDQLDRQISLSNPITDSQQVFFSNIQDRLSRTNNYLIVSTEGAQLEQGLKHTLPVFPQRIPMLLDSCKAENRGLGLAQTNFNQSQQLKLAPETSMWSDRIKAHTSAIEGIDHELKWLSNLMAQSIKYGSILLVIAVFFSLYPAYLARLSPSDQSEIVVNILNNIGAISSLPDEYRRDLEIKVKSRIQEKNRFTTGDILWVFLACISFLTAPRRK